ncbi:single-stranded-DNA-specific exonuclease [Constrictibacter sp. MBR-5]|jgi:single-stranded-DNA-specific exonuclease|uniref:single-stranded-DNA-specific exonuclease RecJ n=1 Tax=Constrictibacter sp. MBR-5 TaxID=3156467 RepID=UPI003396D278
MQDTLLSHVPPPAGSSAGGAFLGVERSLTGRAWRARPCDERLALALTQRLAVPDIVGRVLAGRCVGVEDAEDFLAPRLRSLLPDPSCLRDMDKAATRLAAAVKAGERVVLFGDYDVDGASSVALLRRFLSATGLETAIYIPDRIDEGYGPNAAAMRQLQQQGATLVVALDCGTTAFEALDAAAAVGLDVIVVDHHVAEVGLPHAHAVVNPNRLDEMPGLGHLAAVGVAFLLAVAVNRLLRDDGWFAERATGAPDLMQWLDLVALGTLCDVAPLTGLNRAFVAQGLKIMGARRNAGLSALADVARLNGLPSADQLGFFLGPRINAGGRVGQADLGARLLTTDDPEEARRIAERLDVYNSDRRALEADVVEAALEQAAAHGDAPITLVAGTDWHPGVIGIVAARLVERLHHPACVVSLTDGVGKGSGRSVPGFALGPAIVAARQAGLLEAGGGHAMAAGFTIREERLDDLRAFLAERLQRELPASAAVARPLDLDGLVTPRAATPDLLDLLDRIGPYGSGHDEPRFALSAARIARADIVGERHVRLRLADAGGGALKAIAFRCVGTPMGDALLAARGAPLHVAGLLRADHWNGNRGVQLIVTDAAHPS